MLACHRAQAPSWPAPLAGFLLVTRAWAESQGLPCWGRSPWLTRAGCPEQVRTAREPGSGALLVFTVYTRDLFEGGRFLGGGYFKASFGSRVHTCGFRSLPG